MSGQVAFDDWTSGRSLYSVGTNHRSQELAFQGWQKFKEAFAPELIERAVGASQIPVRRILDPFGGSGTTALAAQFLGVAPVVAEVNPYLADLIEAKLAHYDVASLRRDIEHFVYRVVSLASADSALPSLPPRVTYLPSTFVEPGVKGRWVFSKAVFEMYAGVLWEVERISNPDHRRLLRVVVGGTLVAQSNVRISGKGRRYRSGWSSRQRTPDHVVAAVIDASREALRDIETYNHRAERSYEILRGDARVILSDIEAVELAVFSPPYPNSFDYTDVYNIELWVLGYLSTMSDNQTLRSATLSSHVQILRPFEPAPEGSAQLQFALDELMAVSEKLWSPHLPAMVGGYFADMFKVMSTVATKLVPNGQMWMVVGDSRYAGVDIPVASILEELAEQAGLRHLSTEPFRSMRTSPQQGGAAELAESLIALQKQED